MLEVCASKIGDIILSVLESKMENALYSYLCGNVLILTKKGILYNLPDLN